jgi:agmatinase
MEKEVFCDLPDLLCNLNNSKYFIFPICYEKTTTFLKGTKNAPIDLIKASNQIELYNLELKSLETYDELNSNLSKLFSDIIFPKFKSSKKILPVFIGGEHTITLPIFENFLKLFSNDKISILHFDAHLDRYETYQNEKYHHATVMNNISKLCDNNIVSVGIREASLDEIEEKPNFISAKDIKKNLQLSTKKILDSLNDFVYISFDYDVLDPSVMPSVGTPMCGGIDYFDVSDILMQVFKEKKVIGMDFVEFCKIKGLDYPDITATKIIYDSICYFEKFN